MAEKPLPKCPKREFQTLSIIFDFASGIFFGKIFRFLLTSGEKWCKFSLKKGGDAQLNARFTHSMPDDLDQKVEEVSKQKGMTKTALINMVMSDYIGNYEDPGFFTEIRKRIERIEKELESIKK